MTRRTPTPVTTTLWTLIIIGLATLQFPGILFYHDVTEPRILGMPSVSYTHLTLPTTPYV